MKQRTFSFLFLFFVSWYTHRVTAQATVAGTVLDPGNRTPLVLTAGEYKNDPVLLEASASMLDEVTVTGFGTQHREEIIGNLSKLSADVVQRTPGGGFESAMQRLSPGVMVNYESVKVGFNIDVNIRGISFIDARQQSLYIIDGTRLYYDESTACNIPRISSAEQWKDQWLPGWCDGQSSDWYGLTYDSNAGQKTLPRNL